MNHTRNNHIPYHARRVLSQFTPAIRDEIVENLREAGWEVPNWPELHKAIAQALSASLPTFPEIPELTPADVDRARKAHANREYLTTEEYLDEIRNRMASRAAPRT